MLLLLPLYGRVEEESRPMKHGLERIKRPMVVSLGFLLFFEYGRCVPVWRRRALLCLERGVKFLDK